MSNKDIKQFINYTKFYKFSSDNGGIEYSIYGLSSYDGSRIYISN